jgi:tetratricopeptide (TPR) repeat protein
VGFNLRRRARERRAPEGAKTGPDAADELTTPRTSVADLLRPDREIVPFTGRTEELALLRDWCATGEPRSVRVIVGASGVGKTRLALQVAAEWAAGGALWRPVPDGDEAIAVGAARAVTSSRLLLVVDDAETRAGLADLLTGVQADPGPVRVLLVARSLGEWWDVLASGSGPEPMALLGAPPVTLYAPLSVDGSDSDVAAAAVPSFARALSAAEPVAVEVERSALRLPVLLLHSAALLATVKSAAEPGRLARVVIVDTGVLRRLLGCEARYWRKAAVDAGLPDDEPLLEQAVAAVTLSGPGNAAEAQAVLARLPHLSGGAHEERARWAQWLAGLYPAGPDGRMGLLQPDMLAQTLAVMLLSADPVLARALLRNLPRRQAEHALSMLVRAGARHRAASEVLEAALHYDLGHLAVATASVATRGHPELADVLCDALCNAPAAPEALAQIALDLPHPSRLLAEASLIATLRVREMLPLDTEPEAAAQWDDRAARLLHELDGTADGSGQDLELWTGAVRVATRRQQRFRPELAASLTNLAVRLYELDRPRDALESEQRAVGIYRELVAADPARYRPELASSLTNLSVWFSALGRPDDAVPATEEATMIFRELAAAGQLRYQPALATSLTNLSIWHSEQGRIEESLLAEQEAVEIFRQLAEADPDRYRPDLATSLTNLGIWFSRAGRPEDSAPVEQEAVTLRRALAAADPDRYRVELSTSLTNLSITFRQLGRPADALVPAKEVVVSFRELAAVDPDNYRPELARSLANLGVMYNELGRPRAALAPAKEATSIRRRLADADPRHQLSLARSLDTLGAILAALGRDEEAAKALDEAASITSKAGEPAGQAEELPSADAAEQTVELS